MFYVAGGKVYGVTYDDTLKGYPEFKVTADQGLVATGKVISKKPKNRQVCEAFEVLAQLQTESTSADKEPKE